MKYFWEYVTPYSSAVLTLYQSREDNEEAYGAFSQEGTWWPHVSAGLSELQQPFHAAGVLIYVHGGSVSGASQVVQNIILPFQLCLCLQGEVLQLHQHLHTHTHNPIFTPLWRHTHSVFKLLHTSPQWTWTTEAQDTNKRRLNLQNIGEQLQGGTCGPYVEMCKDEVSELESECVGEKEE